MYASNSDVLGELDRLETLHVSLAPRQIQWLKREAEDRDLSVNPLRRSMIAAEIRRGEEVSVSSSSGDPSRELMEASHGTRDTTDRESTSADRGSPNVVESLRPAS